MCRYFSVCIILLFFTACGGGGQLDGNSSLKQWRSQYLRATKDTDKVALWQKMIDEKVLHEGMSEKEINYIFGIDYMKITPPRADLGTLGRSIINFKGGSKIEYIEQNLVHQQVEKGDMSKGWVLVVSIDSSDQVKRFDFGNYKKTKSNGRKIPIVDDIFN